MVTLPALTLWQPWATMIATPVPVPCACGGTGVIINTQDGGYAETCLCVGRPMVKRFETRSRPCPPKYIGQRVAIHAAKRTPTTRDLHVLRHRWPNISSRPSPSPVGSQPRLPLGAVVATAVITASLPIVDDIPPALITDSSEWVRRGGPCELSIWRDAPNLPMGCHLTRDISDQLPYGNFTPGRFAWALTDVEPVDPPVPAVGRQGWFTVELP